MAVTDHCSGLYLERVLTRVLIKFSLPPIKTLGERPQWARAELKSCQGTEMLTSGGLQWQLLAEGCNPASSWVWEEETLNGG